MMLNRKFIIVCCLISFIGCASSDIGFKEIDGEDGLYRFFGGFSSMEKYHNFLCSKKEKKCIEHVKILIGKLIESNQDLSLRCTGGARVLEETLYVDESATTHVQFSCE